MNKKVKKILIITGWILIISLIAFLIFNVQNRQKKLLCQNLTINLDTNQNFSFINKEQIYKFINDSIGILVGKPLKNINLQKIEKTLARIPFLKDITVYKTLEGDIQIDLKERIPIAHVFTKNNESFYIDDGGVLMPTSPVYTSNVIAVTGEIYEPFSLLLDLKNPASINNYPLLYKAFITAKYIVKDDFWNAMIDQVYINRREEIELIPKLGTHTIKIGNIDNLDKKFNNLIIFYKKVLMKSGWESYESINLKFENKVVCTIKKQL